MSEESWTTVLAIEVEDLRGGERTLRVTCRLRVAGGTRAAAEERITSTMGGVCGFAASKYGMLPEYFLGREATLEKQVRDAIARSDDDRPVPRCEVLALELADST